MPKVMELYNKMEDLTKYTPTELLKMVNDIETGHTNLKKEIVEHTYEADELEKTVNEKIKKLDELEKQYVLLITEINNR